MPNGVAFGPRGFLEADEVAIRRIEDAVADEPVGAGLAGHVDDADAGELGAVVRAIVMSEQLIAAADCQRHRVILDRRAQCRAFVAVVLPGEIGRDGDLLLVLPPAEEVEIVMA